MVAMIVMVTAAQVVLSFGATTSSVAAGPTTAKPAPALNGWVPANTETTIAAATEAIDSSPTADQGAVGDMNGIDGETDANIQNEPTLASGSGSSCGDDYSTVNKLEIVQQFNRPKDHGRMEGSRAKLYCGKHVSTQSESAFGLRHIRAGHMSQFQFEANYGGNDWYQWMVTQLTWTFSGPDRRTVQNADRYCYEKKFNYYEDDKLIRTTWVRVILGRTGQRIMTAFPTNSSNCQGATF